MEDIYDENQLFTCLSRPLVSGGENCLQTLSVAAFIIHKKSYFKVKLFLICQVTQSEFNT